MLQQPGCLACLVRIAVGVSDAEMSRKFATTGLNLPGYIEERPLCLHQPSS